LVIGIWSFSLNHQASNTLVCHMGSRLNGAGRLADQLKFPLHKLFNSD
jgi:hypothetical protein